MRMAGRHARALTRAASQLRELYKGNEGIVVLEAALDRKSGTRTLYTVESEEIPKWAGGMASFQREHILKHEYLIAGLEAMVRELTVSCIPFGAVLDCLPSEELDLLQIDAEGEDGHVLSLFPFDRMQPSIVHWEIKNMTRRQQEEALDLLGLHGYRISQSGEEDMLAVRGPATSYAAPA